MKIVLLSDTHGSKPKGLPEADLLIHAGDWSGYGNYKETRDFINWMQTIRHKFGKVICVPGNHDRWVEANQAQAKQEFKDSNLELLIDEGTTASGAHIWGTPWSPIFSNWAFMADLAKRTAAFNMVPDDVSIMICHAPPKGYLDELAFYSSEPGKNVGCEAYLEAILRIQPELAVCGHIHEGSGITTIENPVTKRQTLLVNASHMDERYDPVNAFKVVYL
jgi:Icc-related predicted phosphoesterase